MLQRSSSHARRDRSTIREPLQVVVRLRPLAGAAAESGSTWRIDHREGQQWVCHQPPRGAAETARCAQGAAFAFDLCLDDKASNRELFDKAAKKLVHAALAGSNASILAYGQTSSGKTHSVLGTPYEPGLLPLSVEEIFSNEGIQRSGNQAKLSYFEIFNEKVIDLLASQSAAAASPLPVKEDAGRGFFVHGLREAPVRSSEDVLRLVARGEERRRYARTRWNDYSSRSHVLFTLSFEPSQIEASTPRSCTKLSIVDLAGCENHKHEASEDGRHINRSLFFLGEVISRLCKDGRRGPRAGAHRRSPSGPADLRKPGQESGPSTPRHAGALGEGRPQPRSRERSVDFIPYRDSKLTRVLRSSLGGDALTMLLVTVHPALCFAEQSLTSLRFAAKARCVENCIPSYPETPVRYDEDRPAIGNQIMEGLSERRLLSNSGLPPGVPDTYQRGRRPQDARGEAPVELNKANKELRQLRAELAEKERELASKARLLCERDRELGQLREQLDMERRVNTDGLHRARHGDASGLPSGDPWSPLSSSGGLSYAGSYGKDEDRESEGSQGRLSTASRAEDIPCLRTSSFVTRQQNLVSDDGGGGGGGGARGGETQEELVEKLVKLAVMQINTVSKVDLPAPPEYGWSPEGGGEHPEGLKVLPGLSALPVPSNPDVQGTPRKPREAEDQEFDGGYFSSMRGSVPALPGARS